MNNNFLDLFHICTLADNSFTSSMRILQFRTIYQLKICTIRQLSEALRQAVDYA